MFPPYIAPFADSTGLIGAWRDSTFWDWRESFFWAGRPICCLLLNSQRANLSWSYSVVMSGYSSINSRPEIRNSNTFFLNSRGRYSFSLLMRLNHFLVSHLSSHWLLFLFSTDLKFIFLLSDIPAQTKLPIFTGWIKNVKHAKPLVLFPFCFSAWSLLPKNICLTVWII